MERNRKLLISILAVLVLSSVIAIVDISMNMQQKRGAGISLSSPKIGPGVGIVRVEGAIQMMSSSGLMGADQGAEAIIRRLDDLANNSDIRAIVVRINSPGGTVSATQEIFEKIMKIRKDKKITLVASMGEIAASGGYYIASACDRIVANRGTITASIGVIAVSPNLRGLFEKLGIHMNVIKSGRYKDILSMHRDITPEERQLIQEMIDSSYNNFLKDISRGRSMSIADIEPVADGRVMSGETALKNKLIDKLGTFEDAIDEARRIARLPENSPVYDEGKSSLQQLLFNMGGMFGGRGPLPLEYSRGADYLRYENQYRIEYRFQP